MGHAGVALDRVGAWRNRPIEGEHPYVYLDGIVLKRSWAGEVRNASLLVAIGVNESGYREILGICEEAKEDKAGWSAFLKHLQDRGLKGIRLIRTRPPHACAAGSRAGCAANRLGQMKSFGQICIPLNSSIAPVLEKDPNHGRLCVIMKQVCVTMKHRCVTQVEKFRGCARVAEP